MTTAGNETHEPDGAQHGFLDSALEDTGKIARGPAFAQSSRDHDALGGVDRVTADRVASDGVTADSVASDGVAADGVDVDTDDDDDGDFAPRARQRFGALSAVLVVALAVALGFLGGEIIQKHYGATASASGTANRAANFARGEGAAAFGGNGGFGQPGANGAGAGTGTGAGTGAGTGTGTGNGTGTGTGTSVTPAVIGTVSSIKGTIVIVTNLGGTKVTVRLTGATTVTVAVKDKALRVGQTVAVVGKTAAKVVTATSVVVQ